MKFWKWLCTTLLVNAGIILTVGAIGLCSFNPTATSEFRASYGSFSIAGAILLAAVYVKEDW